MIDCFNWFSVLLCNYLKELPARLGRYKAFAIRRHEASLFSIKQPFLSGERCREADRGFSCCAGLPRLAAEGLLPFLDKKVAKNQGLELMSDKIVKALFRQHKHPMKNRERTGCLGLCWFERLWLKL